MPVTIHTYSMKKFHGEAKEYTDKIITERTGMPFCARCEGEHESLQWKGLTNPKMSAPEGARPSAIIAWAMCPTLNEPVFIEAWADNETEAEGVQT